MINPDALLLDKIGGSGSAGVIDMSGNVDRFAGDSVSAVVASGPGGPAGRVTDLTLAAIGSVINGGNGVAEFVEITERLVAHAEPLGSDAVALATQTAHEMERGLHEGAGVGWVTMGPERYQAGIYALMLGEAGVHAAVLNPTQFIRRDRQGAIDLGASVRLLSPQLTDSSVVHVLPGTPGVNEDLQVLPVTPALRGYSDTSAMVVAAALQAARGRHVTYRNIKGAGVPGILRMPPGLGVQPGVTPELSIVEAGVLGAGGNSVIHPAVLGLLQEAEDVSLQVCSGLPGEEGTAVVRNRKIRTDETIAGIALQEVLAFAVSDVKMEHQSGVATGITGAFSAMNIPLVDVETGYGAVTAYVANGSLSQSQQDALQEQFSNQYDGRFALRGAESEQGLTIVTLVGEAMAADNEKRADVMRDAARTAKVLGAEVRFWPSPSGNAVYLETLTGSANDMAVATYNQYFS